MNKKTYFLTSLLFSVLFFNGVHAQDTLIIKRVIDLQVANRSGEILKLKYVIKSAMAEELPDVAKCFRRARFFNVISSPFAFAGGFLIGYTLGKGTREGNKIEPMPIILGSGLIVVHLGLVAGFKDRNIRKGVRLYNEALHSKRLYPAAD